VGGVVDWLGMPSGKAGDTIEPNCNTATPPSMGVVEAGIRNFYDRPNLNSVTYIAIGGRRYTLAGCGENVAYISGVSCILNPMGDW